MQFVSARIITADLDRSLAFYEALTGIKATRYTDDFAELVTPSATLAIGSTRTLALFGGPAIAEAASNRSVLLEFLVPDTDALYKQLEVLLAATLVQAPTTMPWGNRSLLVRDPDGNLVNLFTPVSPEAVAKFAGKGR